MLTIVMIGPATRTADAKTILEQAGATILSDHPRGYSVDNGEAAICAQIADLSFLQWKDKTVPPDIEWIGWTLRGHWEEDQSGRWSKIGRGGSPLLVHDPIAELEKLKKQLSAAGIVLPEVD